jgi:tRNA(Ile)-lysidine synthase
LAAAALEKAAAPDKADGAPLAGDRPAYTLFLPAAARETLAGGGSRQLSAAALAALDPVLARRAIRLWLGRETDQAGIQRVLALAANQKDPVWAELAGGMRVAKRLGLLSLAPTAAERQPADSPPGEGPLGPGMTVTWAPGGGRFAAMWAPPDGERAGMLLFQSEGENGPGQPRPPERYLCRWAAGAPWPTLRRRRPGDWLRLPYGRKKLKLLLNEKKVPPPWREALPLLTRGDQVLWIPGLVKALGPYD